MSGKERIHNLLAKLQETAAPVETSLETEFQNAVRIREIRKLKGGKARIQALLDDLK